MASGREHGLIRSQGSPIPATFDPRRVVEASALIRAFYAAVLFLTVVALYNWEAGLGREALEPRWPIFWIRWVGAEAGIPLVLALALVGAIGGLTLSQYRSARVLVFISQLELLALTFSHGSINHGSHLRLLLCFVLVFLPHRWSDRTDRRGRAATLLTFSAGQGMILLIYSMSGLWKVVGLARQLVAGEVSYLSPTGLAQQVASKLLAGESGAPLGPWLIDNYWLGPPLALGSIYLEFFALWIVARPALHRAWGLGLILFHVSTQLTMGIAFPEHLLWLSLFLVFSPFRPSESSWRAQLRALPVIGGRLPT